MLKGWLAGPGGVMAAVAVVVAAAIGYFFLSYDDPTAPVAREATLRSDVSAVNPTPETEPRSAVQPPSGDATTDAEGAREPSEPSVLERLPQFGDVRLEASGLVVIAGTAPPGFDVSVQDDAEVLATAQANGSGDFAMVFDLAFSGTPRVLYLTARGEGQELRSEESVILTPPIAVPTEPSEGPVSGPVAVDVAAVEAAKPDAQGSAEADLPAASEDMRVGLAAEETGALAVGGAGAADTEDTGEPFALETAKAPETGAASGSDPDAASGQTAAAATDETVPDQATVDLAEPEPARSGTSGASPDRAQLDGAGEDPAPSSTVPPLPEVTAADSAPTVLLSGRDGIELLQPAPGAEAPDAGEVVVDAISYAEDGSVALAGRAGGTQDLGRVQVYLDNRLRETGDVAADGDWRLQLPPVAPGVYTLRVDQVDATGKVTARFETPFKREDPEALAERVATDPSPGAVAARVITVQPGFTLWGIATNRYGDGYEYVQIFEANRSQIRDPDLIYPGQVFELPDVPTTPE